MKGPFFTGSQAYGKPREDSDIDLVVCCDDINVKRKLFELSEASGVIFGKLNLIVVSSAQYDSWHKATKELIALKAKRGKPIARGEAVKVMKRHGVTSYIYAEEQTPAAGAAHVTVTSGLSGYYAVVVDAHGEPWSTGHGRYPTKDEAWPEAESIAKAEGLPLRGRQ